MTLAGIINASPEQIWGYVEQYGDKPGYRIRKILYTLATSPGAMDFILQREKEERQARLKRMNEKKLARPTPSKSRGKTKVDQSSDAPLTAADVRVDTAFRYIESSRDRLVTHKMPSDWPKREEAAVVTEPQSSITGLTDPRTGASQTTQRKSQPWRLSMPPAGFPESKPHSSTRSQSVPAP